MPKYGKGRVGWNSTPKIKKPRNLFDISFNYKTTLNADNLVPCYVAEVLPGDTFKCNPSFFGRFTTLKTPIMDNIYIDYFFFFVPNRILWNKWEKFNGEQDNPSDSIDFLVPIIQAPAGGYTEESIYDYFGIPTKVAGLQHSALPFRAYNKIFNDWFRDQNVDNSLVENVGDGPDPSTDYTVQKRRKKNDYFTSCLPFLQKGSAVSLPLGVSAPVKTQSTNIITGAQSPLKFLNINGSDLNSASRYLGATGPSGNAHVSTGVSSVNHEVYPSNLFADLNLAAGATINQVREAFQIQAFLELNARSGSRYTEILESHFGVQSSDGRLQRPEYLGGGSVPLEINTITQNSSGVTSPAVQPLGGLAGNGVMASSGNGFDFSAEEHGYIIGIVNIRGDINYQQGLDRHWSRRTRFDFADPFLANIGEQAVLNKEIYAKADANDNLVFGYQERYAEYRSMNNKITGKLRSNTTGPLDYWHIAENFAALPVLNSSFKTQNTPISRVVSVTSEPHFVLDCRYVQSKATVLPLYGTPGSLMSNMAL